MDARTQAKPAMENTRENVQSLERGLSVLRSFDAQHSRMTLSAVAARTGLTRATARRFLLTLVRLNLVGSDGKLFWLQPAVLDLGFRYLSSLPWWQSAQPIIEDVSRSMHESCSLSVLDGFDIVYVARAAVNRILSANVSIGSRFPAYCTSMGRILLSNLSDGDLDSFLSRAPISKLTEKTITDPVKLRGLIRSSRKQGYAISDQELEYNLFAVAVPIFDNAGNIVAALGASVPVGAGTQANLLRRLLPIMKEGAQRITSSLEGQALQPTGAVTPYKPRGQAART
jgi:IclR family pca regulon transcriptional regulator